MKYVNFEEIEQLYIAKMKEVGLVSEFEKEGNDAYLKEDAKRFVGNLKRFLMLPDNETQIELKQVNEVLEIISQVSIESRENIGLSEEEISLKNLVKQNKVDLKKKIEDL